MNKEKILKDVKKRCDEEGLLNVAKRVGISPSHLSNITKHVGSINPSKKVLEKLKDV